MSPFEQVLRAAEEARQSHHAREAALTQAHYQAHPECCYKILAMDDAGNVQRGKTIIDIEARCRPGWFTRPMWTQNADDIRPMESRQSQTQGYWYRVDDLRHTDVLDAQGSPATREMGNLLRKALLIDKEVKEAEAKHKAEVMERRKQQREQRLTQRPLMPPLARRTAKSGPFLAAL
jgi:hypothetical protein